MVLPVQSGMLWEVSESLNQVSDGKWDEKDVETEVERWKDKWIKLIGPQTLQHCLSFALCPSSKSWMQKAHCSTTAVTALSLWFWTTFFDPNQKVFAAEQIHSLTNSSEGEVSKTAFADL